MKSVENTSLSYYVADKTPLYYREFDKVVESLKDGFMLTTFKETLDKLPTSEHFRSSHFGEIAASLFVEEVIGLTKLYCKLSLNTSEHQHGYKMDLVCYVPGSDPVEFVFCEVKSSPKDATDGLPANHHQSCYADIFNSLREYEEGDKKFDLTLIKDHLSIIDQAEKERVRNALIPYTIKKVSYIGIAVIDHSTFDESEVPVLATRKSGKEFNVELLCVESYKEVAAEVYAILEGFKKHLK